ncbi:MAG: ABC transporter permease [Tannerella sp.]|jgi:ABC-2 type transport system permease protein|nr:ABC transporter permease [Tannerella sp.]
MNKIGLIIRREYLHRVRKKSFILLTLLTPLLMAAMLFVPLWLASFKGDTINIAIIDQTGKYAPLFKDTDHYKFHDANQSLEEYRADENKELFAVLNISDNLLENPQAATLYSEKQIPGDLSRLVNQILTKQIESDKLASFQIPDLENIIKESRVNFNIQTIKWGKDGTESSSSAAIAHILGILSTLAIYMFIMMYGSMVMQSVTEEKTSRIVEIMVSSVRPFDLMIGKIIGIGLVGITQICLWGILLSIFSGIGGLFIAGGMPVNEMQTTMAMQPDMMLPDELSWLTQLQSFNFGEILLYFILFFIGGYLLYASVFAAIGSAANAPEDSQQLMMPISILLIFALYAGIYGINNPDGPLAFWCSMIPFTSPIVMIMRIPYEIPLWQKLVSVILLYATSISLIWISAKIYRIGILMYGKKPQLKEIVKWITFK